MERNNALVEARRSLKLTQKELTSKIGIKLARYSHYETGRTYPPQEIQNKIIDFFDNKGVFLEPEEIFPEQSKEITFTGGKLETKMQSWIYQEPDKIEKLSMEERREKLSKYLKRLYHRESDVIITKYFYEPNKVLSNSDVGEVLGISRITVNKRLKQGLARLANMILKDSNI